MSKRRALVAMSGGVDSAVAALLTVRAGYEAHGVTMNLCHAQGDGTCGSSADADDARAIADRLGMTHEVMHATDVFDREVKAAFVDAYEKGETPNPCILCNRHLKFGRLLAYAQSLGMDTLVTGHYARVERDPDNGEFRLKRARALSKDQSYVLYFLSQEQLSHLYFPLGDVTSKEEVRAVATENGFSSASRPDSQDICFIPDRDYGAFIRSYTGRDYAEGDFITPDGRVVGRHRGLIHYTVGQRKGLGVAFGAPMYVKCTSVENNTVTLSSNEALFESECLVREMCYTASRAPTAPFRAEVKPRYKAPAAPATVEPLSDGCARICFDTPQRALTPGQAAVLYDGDTVLGGGILAHVGALTDRIGK